VIGRGREEGRTGSTPGNHNNERSAEIRSGDIYNGKMYGTETTCTYSYFAD